MEIMCAMSCYKYILPSRPFASCLIQQKITEKIHSDIIVAYIGYFIGIDLLEPMWEEEFIWKGPAHPDCTIDCTTPARIE
jgi:hypothetical protein